MVIKDRDSTAFIIRPPGGVNSVQFKFNADSYYNGMLMTDFVTAYDDGTHGDAVVGDSLFTLNHISLPPQFSTGSPLLSSGILFVGTQFKFTWADNSVTTESPVDVQPGLIVVNPEKTWNEPQMTQINESLFVSPRVANFVVDEKKLKVDYTEGRSKYTTTFYQHFGDDYDLVFLGLNYLFDIDRLVAARSARTRTYEMGTWNTDFFPANYLIPYDYNSILGSGGRLQSVVELMTTHAYSFNVINHEILHNWCAFVFPISNSSGNRLGHWNLIERSTTGFGGPSACTGIVTAIEHVGGDTFRVAYNFQNPTQAHYYNDLELYMMGLAAIDEISFPVRMLFNARNETYENEVNGVLTELFEADSIANITRAQLLQFAGERIPSVAASPKSFNVALMILSPEKLTPLEFAFYEKVMTMYEQDSTGEQLTELPTLTFHQANGGRATIHAILNLNSQPVAAACRRFQYMRGMVPPCTRVCSVTALNGRSRSTPRRTKCRWRAIRGLRTFSTQETASSSILNLPPIWQCPIPGNTIT